MNDLLKSDALTCIDTDRVTGQPRRKWIEYADGVVEPVRKAGNLNRKFHGNKRSLDWWTVDKPVDWNPLDEGRDVSLNHDYGREAKPQARPGGQTVPARPGHGGEGRRSRAKRRAPRAARPKRPMTRPAPPEPSAAWCSPRGSMEGGKLPGVMKRLSNLRQLMKLQSLRISHELKLIFKRKSVH